MAKIKQFRELESTLKFAFANSAQVLLSQLQKIDVRTSEEVLSLIDTPPENILRFKNRLDEKLVNAGFERWEPILIKRFRVFAVGEASSTFSYKRILGVLKIVNKIRKFPRDILIWIAEYACDIQGTEYEVCNLKKEIDAMAPGKYGDIYLATNRQILLWNSLTWKTTTLIRKMKKINAKSMAYAGNSMLIVLQRKTRQVFTINLKTQERAIIPQFEFLEPKALRCNMSNDDSKIAVAVISNYNIGLYQSGVWRNFEICDIIPRSLQFFQNELYTLHSSEQSRIHLQDTGPAEYAPLSFEPHTLSLMEKKFAQKLYKDFTYGFLTSQGDWFRLHRCGFTYYSIRDDTFGSIEFPRFISMNIKNPWLYEPFSNCVYRIVGDQRLQVRQIVL